MRSVPVYQKATDATRRHDRTGGMGKNQAHSWPGSRPRAGPVARRLPFLAVVLLLLTGCQGPRAEPRTDLPAEPWAMVAEAGGLWVVLGDHTVARYDPATARIDGASVRLPFTPGAMVGGHGDLWIGGQVDGRRGVTAVVALPLRSNGNRLASTPSAVWVADPAEGVLSRIWRVDPATNRP